MSVHGINADSKGKTQETGDWSVKTVSNKAPVLDTKRKPLTGLSYKTAREASYAYTNRTGEYTVPVRG